MKERSKKGPPSKDGMLLVVDAQNLYYSARELYGKGSRIDFLKLRERIAGTRSFGVIYSIAFIPEIREDTQPLAKALHRLGYEVLARTERFDAQVQELERLAPQYAILAVASGSGDFIPLYRKMKEIEGKRVEVYCFIDAANGEISKYADQYEHLKAEVLLGDYSTVEVLKEGPV